MHYSQETLQLNLGSDVDLLALVSTAAGFTFDLLASPFWMVLAENGTWLGSIGDVSNGRADVSIGIVSISEVIKLPGDDS